MGILARVKTKVYTMVVRAATMLNGLEMVPIMKRWDPKGWRW